MPSKSDGTSNNAMGSALPRPEGLLKMEYVPRKQFVPFHERRQRHSVLVTHRRCGKTVASICDLIMRAVAHPGSKPAGRFAYIATTYSAGKDIAWEMLKAYSRPPNEWQRLAGRIAMAFNQVVLDEYADMPPSLFSAVIRPALADRRGKSCFIGTVRGRENHLWQTYSAAINDPDWYTDLLTASETGLVPESELAAAKRDMGEDRYASEFECNPDSPIVGSYYGSG
jgi:phage terminase large subunit